MSRAHAEIAHQTRRLGQLIDDIGHGQPDEADIADLRALLYGLHAILRLHTAQEDESYLSLAEDAQAMLPPASPGRFTHVGPRATALRELPGDGDRASPARMDVGTIAAPWGIPR